MLNLIPCLFLALCLLGQVRAQTSSKTSDEDVLFVAGLYEQALTQGQSPQWLRHLCKEIGGRPAGSAQDTKAQAYMRYLLDSLQADSVWTQEVKVPYWERGELAEAYILLGEERLPLSIAALGFSGATPKEGLNAPVIEVKSLQELEKLGAAKVKGKIVFFNRPMDATRINTFHAYGGAVDQRSSGPRKAAELGAVACVVRSMTLRQDDVPHTGMTSFGQTKPIPAAALSWLAADQLGQRLREQPGLSLFLRLDCQHLGERSSYNVIGEWRGKKKEIILVGGHLDAWDLGEGAHDDGTGVVQALETIALLRQAGYKHQHSLRCVLFAAEEIGLYGANVYAKQAEKEKLKHLAAIESDAGGHLPIGFVMDAVEGKIKPAFHKVKAWREILIPYGLYYLEPGGSAADISPLKSQGTILFGFRPDSQRYFDYHHCIHDRFEAVNPRELVMGSASMAALIYLIDKYGL